MIDGSTDKIIDTIAVGIGPILYCVANTFSSDIYIIDGSNNNVVASIPFDAHPHSVAYNPANNDT